MTEATRTQTIQRWIRLYGYLILLGGAYGVVIAHLPVILGHPWSVCQIDGGTSLPCVLTVHMYDVAFTFFLIIFGWYSVFRASAGRLSVYKGFLLASLMVAPAFFTFETVLLLWNFHHAAAPWESYLIASVALILIIGFILGVYVYQKVSTLAQMDLPPVGAPIPRGPDGFYHPASEAEIIGLVKFARTMKLQIRCRGAAHSVAHAIYTSPGAGEPQIPNKVEIESPPDGPNLNLMLDKLTGLKWDPDRPGVVEAEAGIHLGRDPHDPTGNSTLENGLLYQAWDKGWGLDDLGGITHQTVSGFTATGSAGGSLTYDLAPNILAYRVVDGRGEPRWIDRHDEQFGAVALSLGLMGIVTKVRLQLQKTYNIKGEQRTTPVSGSKCPIDLFGPGDASKPSLQKFLEDTPYTRLLWWPQKKAKRLVTWQASRAPASDENLKPYEEFGEDVGGEIEQLAGAVFFTLLGNRGFFRTWKKLNRDFVEFRKNVFRLWRKSLGSVFGGILASLLTAVVSAVAFLLVVFFSIFKGLLRALFPMVLNIFQPMSKGKPITFHDYYWRSLPMDNTAGDVLLGTEFTELFIPLRYTERAMRLLDQWFDGQGPKATGYYSVELYAGYKSSFWMHPAYASGEYEEGTCRFDFFWYTNNEGTPNERGGYFDQFWKLFRENGIPFRLHWGKFIPDYDFDDWAAYYRSQLPRWDDFLAVRRERDPDNVFLTDYWKRRLQVKD